MRGRSLSPGHEVYAYLDAAEIAKAYGEASLVVGRSGSSLAEFAAWATLAGVIQIAAFSLVRILFLKDVKTRIEAGELAPALYLASISIAVGLINAASMTD